MLGCLKLFFRPITQSACFQQADHKPADRSTWAVPSRAPGGHLVEEGPAVEQRAREDGLHRHVLERRHELPRRDSALSQGTGPQTSRPVDVSSPLSRARGAPRRRRARGRAASARRRPSPPRPRAAPRAAAPRPQEPSARLGKYVLCTSERAFHGEGALSCVGTRIGYAI